MCASSKCKQLQEELCGSSESLEYALVSQKNDKAFPTRLVAIRIATSANLVWLSLINAMSVLQDMCLFRIGTGNPPKAADLTDSLIGQI